MQPIVSCEEVIGCTWEMHEICLKMTDLRRHSILPVVHAAGSGHSLSLWHGFA